MSAPKLIGRRLYSILSTKVTRRSFGKDKLESQVKPLSTTMQQADDNVCDSIKNLNIVGKRKDYLQWADYFMGVALLSAHRSKDPNTQVGACIVNNDNKIVGTGYNGMPTGCSDDKMPWNKYSTDPLEVKFLYVCHAEMNAIFNKSAADIRGCTMFCTKFPCNECTKVIIQSGLSKIIYLDGANHDKVKYVAARRMLDMAGVSYEQHIPKTNEVTLSFKT